MLYVVVICKERPLKFDNTVDRHEEVQFKLKARDKRHPKKGMTDDRNNPAANLWTRKQSRLTVRPDTRCQTVQTISLFPKLQTMNPTSIPKSSPPPRAQLDLVCGAFGA